MTNFFHFFLSPSFHSTTRTELRQKMNLSWLANNSHQQRTRCFSFIFECLLYSLRLQSSSSSSSRYRRYWMLFLKESSGEIFEMSWNVMIGNKFPQKWNLLNADGVGMAHDALLLPEGQMNKLWIKKSRPLVTSLMSIRKCAIKSESQLEWKRYKKRYLHQVNFSLYHANWRHFHKFNKKNESPPHFDSLTIDASRCCKKNASQSQQPSVRRTWFHAFTILCIH